MPGKRTNPSANRAAREAIYRDITNRLIQANPDTEAPEDVVARRKKSPPPRKKGAKVVGFKKLSTFA